MAQQSSRLNRLLTLLDTGSTQATRFSAARQIGEIAKSHPQDLNALLSKLSQYLRSKRWDTRVAAAHAVGAIAENVKHITLNEISSCVVSKMLEAEISATFEEFVTWQNLQTKIGGSTSFRSFDLKKVLEFGALVASGGQEYDIAKDNSRVLKNVWSNYPGNGVGFQYFSSQPRNIQHFVTSMVPKSRSRRPSARELNLLKCKAKSNSKDQFKGWLKDGDTDATQSRDMVLPKAISMDSTSSNKVNKAVHDVHITLQFADELLNSAASWGFF